MQGYLIDAFPHDPAALIADRPGPVLIVQGGCDLQMTPQDARRLAGAAPWAEPCLPERMSHALKEVNPADNLASYADPDRPIAPDLVRAVAGFVTRHAGVSAFIRAGNDPRTASRADA
ncbi:hypothetical protein [Paracoccus sp. ME4]|uniref:hypothetical protein n=1 Tax=Paracoccus sp. ME4 TaxID=3138066 RepID=UPI00398B29AF